jgi:hypothetical protein
MRTAYEAQFNECDEGDVGFCVQIPWHDGTIGIWSVEHFDFHEAQCAKYAADCKALGELLAEEQARQVAMGVHLTHEQVDKIAYDLWFADFWCRY